jgi:hypothetical protein
VAQKVSDILKRQDADTARGLVQVLTALQARYRDSLELKCAIRDTQDFAALLTREVSAPAAPASEEPRG